MNEARIKRAERLLSRLLYGTPEYPQGSPPLAGLQLRAGAALEEVISSLRELQDEVNTMIHRQSGGEMTEEQRKHWIDTARVYYSEATSSTRKNMDREIISARAFHDDQLAPVNAMAYLLQLLRSDEDA